MRLLIFFLFEIPGMLIQTVPGYVMTLCLLVAYLHSVRELSWFTTLAVATSSIEFFVYAPEALLFCWNFLDGVYDESYPVTELLVTAGLLLSLLWFLPVALLAARFPRLGGLGLLVGSFSVVCYGLGNWHYGDRTLFEPMFLFSPFISGDEYYVVKCLWVVGLMLVFGIWSLRRYELIIRDARLARDLKTKRFETLEERFAYGEFSEV